MQSSHFIDAPTASREHPERCAKFQGTADQLGDSYFPKKCVMFLGERVARFYNRDKVFL